MKKQCNMKTFSPYQIAWIVLKPTKGIALKSDSEKTHFGRTFGMLVMHYPTQDKAKESLKRLSSKKLNKKYEAYIITDKQFGMLKEDNFMSVLTTKQKENMLIL